ncbi:glycoside hydrolase family 43 protein [Lentzea sp. HUAS12]|uniref:glycoside hydrolase family 43 protein n=1 Tax=Lentzea sp. HUAS12 TaxID=2951806 RepID=UPI0020A1834A|nr:glycoside hydrolase family 43 protein [Lentzea sp. HUAS12]USX53179.1 glycoside hydrolase family 43 protein [Lentzea sp. HUAS12]
MAQFENPILPGSHPDPSVCRAGSDYYLVTSTFEYFPGLPIYHSRDLVHWRLLGHVLDRPSQLPLQGVRASGGLYAPTIRYHDGVFYVVCTLVDGTTKSGNFVVTATDPAGEWSEPQWLPEADGFDPSLFFGDDGRAWWTGTREVPGGGPGQTEVWLREFDPVHRELIGDEHVLWTGALRDSVWLEAPHLYEVGGKYVLLCAEGGTDFEHSVVVATADEVTGPYRGSPLNPVLTHRHLGRDHPIAAAGHADLVLTQHGQWFAVLLATRPYGGYNYNLGRETFLVPVSWEAGGPVFSPGTGRVETRYDVPALPAHPWPEVPETDDFDGPVLDPSWMFLRTPDEVFWSLADRPGHLRLRVRPESVTDLATPSLVVRRQQHQDFHASCVLEFDPARPGETAGMVLLQNDEHHVRLLLGSHREVTLVVRAGGQDTPLARTTVPDGAVRLCFEATGQDYRALVASGGGEWRPLGEPFDGRVLSTQAAGGFTGVHIGLLATSSGAPSGSWADFGSFTYRGLSPSRERSAAG